MDTYYLGAFRGGLSEGIQRVRPFLFPFCFSINKLSQKQFVPDKEV